MIQRVAAKFDAVLLHFLRLFPRQVVRIAPYIVSDQEDRGFHAPFFQYRISDRIVIEISVVEGEKDGFWGQRRAALQGVGQLRGSNCVVARGFQIVHLGGKLRRSDG